MNPCLAPCTRPIRPFRFLNTRKRIPKLIGEFVELLFLAKAAAEGFWPSKPYGDSRPYDFILDTGRRLLKVQVKSSSYCYAGAYNVTVGCARSRTYRLQDVDFIVLCIVPADAWYVIPLSQIRRRRTLWITPGDRRCRFEKFREAWHLMR